MTKISIAGDLVGGDIKIRDTFPADSSKRRVVAQSQRHARARDGTLVGGKFAAISERRDAARVEMGEKSQKERTARGRAQPTRALDKSERHRAGAYIYRESTKPSTTSGTSPRGKTRASWHVNWYIRKLLSNVPLYEPRFVFDRDVFHQTSVVQTRIENDFVRRIREEINRFPVIFLILEHIEWRYI